MVCRAYSDCDKISARWATNVSGVRNIVLFKGRDPAEVRKKAEKLALKESVPDETVTLGGRRARLVFLGVRKIVECQDSTARAIKYPARNLSPGEGTEVSYSLLTVNGARDLEALTAGQPVTVRYEAD